MDTERPACPNRGNCIWDGSQPPEKQGRGLPGGPDPGTPGSVGLFPWVAATSLLMRSSVSWLPKSPHPTPSGCCVCCGLSAHGSQDDDVLPVRQGSRNGVSHGHERRTGPFLLEAGEPLHGFLSHGGSDPKVALPDQGSPPVT